MQYVVYLESPSLLQAFRCDFLPARCYACAVLAVIAYPSVHPSCLSICHKPGLYTVTATCKIMQTTLHDRPGDLRPLQCSGRRTGGVINI